MQIIQGIAGAVMIYLLTAALFLMGCGESLEKSELDLSKHLESAVSEYFGVTIESPDYFLTEGIDKFCPDSSRACVSTSKNTIYLQPQDRNDCKVIAHELSHIGLKLSTGNSDYYHEDPIFLRIQSTFCEGL